MRSKLQVDALLHAVAEAAVATRAMTLGVLESRAVAALDSFAVAVAADRACLCYATGVMPAGPLDRFLSGGHPDSAPIGPALLAVRVDEVPEWSVEPDAARPIPRPSLSAPLARALAGTEATWVVSVPLREADAVVGVLSLVGRDEPPDDELAPAVRTMTELMHGVARRAAELTAPAPAPAHARVALDVVAEGVFFLDPHGRVVSLNRAARDQLGCSPGDLDPDLPVWEQFDIRFPDGSPTVTSTASGWFDRTGVFGPVPVRLVNRRGLVVFGELTVRAAELDHSTGLPEMLVVLSPSPGLAAAPAPADSAAIESVLRRADELFQELQRALTAGGRAAGHELPPTLAGVGLSARERDVVVLLLEGHRVSTIAQRLFLSPHTVRNHLKAIFRKAKVGSQAALIDLARTATVDA